MTGWETWGGGVHWEALLARLRDEHGGVVPESDGVVWWGTALVRVRVVLGGWIHEVEAATPEAGLERVLERLDADAAVGTRWEAMGDIVVPARGGGR